jgi:peptide/nickel transport system substrate-binding protein
MKHLFAGALLLLLPVAACSHAAGEASARAHLLRIAVTQEPKNLNPLLVTETTDIFIDRLMFEPLLSADARGNPVPMLAERVPTLANGGISKDGLTIVYRLRRDARWSDGVPVTSQDVAWTWQAILNPRNSVLTRHGYDVVASLSTPNSRTVVVRLKRRFAPFVDTFFAESDQAYAILPAHAFAAGVSIDRVAFNGAPAVSDGPFRFVSWNRGDRILLAANERFFNGKPALRGIALDFVPDENTGVNLLRTRAVDYLFEPSVATYPSLRGIPGAKVVWVDTNGFEAVEFNVSHPVVSDPRVRLAIAYALDKAAIIRQLTFGQARVATEDLPPWMWAFDPSVHSYPFDIARAKSLMQRAGFAYGGDGIARKNGRAAQLLLATDTESATHRSESLLIQAALRRIGILVEVKAYPASQLYATVALGGILQSSRFDLTTAPWAGGIDPDDSSEFTCAMRPPNGYNTSRYCTSEMDRWQQRALSQYDRPLRTLAYSHVQRLLARDNPYVFLWWQRQPEAISDAFDGFSPNPVTESWNAWQWRIR